MQHFDRSYAPFGFFDKGIIIFMMIFMIIAMTKILFSGFELYRFMVYRSHIFWLSSPSALIDEKWKNMQPHDILQKERVHYVLHAGFEYAFKEMKHGRNPSGSKKKFEDTELRVHFDPLQKRLSVTASAGDDIHQESMFLHAPSEDKK